MLITRRQDFTDWAVLKIQISEAPAGVRVGQVRSWLEPLLYPAEPIFIPDPEGQREDDGVLLFNAYAAGDL